MCKDALNMLRASRKLRYKLPIFYAIYDAFFHTTFPTSNGLYTTFPTSKIVVNFRQTTTYSGLFPQKSDPTDLGIRTIGKEKPRKTEVFRGKENFLALAELRCATSGFEAVFLDLQNLQSIALQWIAVFENQFPFKMNPVNFYHIV